MLVVENTKMRFFVGDFSWKELATLHDHLHFERLRYTLLFPPKKFGNIVEGGRQLSKTFFRYKISIRAHHAEHADRSFVSQEFESVYSQTQVHSASCQTRVTRNEIVSIGAFTDSYLNQIISSDCQRM